MNFVWYDIKKKFKGQKYTKYLVKYRPAADMTNVTHEILVYMIPKFFTFTV